MVQYSLKIDGDTFFIIFNLLQFVTLKYCYIAEKFEFILFHKNKLSQFDTFQSGVLFRQTSHTSIQIFL